MQGPKSTQTSAAGSAPTFQSSRPETLEIRKGPANDVYAVFDTVFRVQRRSEESKLRKEYWAPDQEHLVTAVSNTFTKTLLPVAQSYHQDLSSCFVSEMEGTICAKRRLHRVQRGKGDAATSKTQDGVTSWAKCNVLGGHRVSWGPPQGSTSTESADAKRCSRTCLTVDIPSLELPPRSAVLSHVPGDADELARSVKAELIQMTSDVKVTVRANQVTCSELQPLGPASTVKIIEGHISDVGEWEPRNSGTSDKVSAG